jgi:hypothetical protein
MAEMSPLARVLMMILQKGSWAAAGLLALFAGILLWQRHTLRCYSCWRFIWCGVSGKRFGD